MLKSLSANGSGHKLFSLDVLEVLSRVEEKLTGGSHIVVGE